MHRGTQAWSSAPRHAALAGRFAHVLLTLALGAAPAAQQANATFGSSTTSNKKRAEFSVDGWTHCGVSADLEDAAHGFDVADCVCAEPEFNTHQFLDFPTRSSTTAAATWTAAATTATSLPSSGRPSRTDGCQRRTATTGFPDDDEVVTGIDDDSCTLPQQHSANDLSLLGLSAESIMNLSTSISGGDVGGDTQSDGLDSDDDDSEPD